MSTADSEATKKHPFPGMFTGLRARLILLVLLVMLPALGLAVYNSSQMRIAAKAVAYENAKRLVLAVASNQAAVFEGAREMLISLGQSPWARSLEIETCQSVLFDTVRRLPQYQMVAIFDLDANFLCGSPYLSGENANISNWMGYQLVRERRSFVVSDFQFKQGITRPSLGLAYPLYDSSGTRIGFIMALLELKWLNLQQPAIDLPQGSTLVVTDSNGSILVHNPDQEAWVGRELDVALVEQIENNSNTTTGTFEYTPPGGEPSLNAFTRLDRFPETGGMVLIQIPTRLAFQTADQQTYIQIGGLIIVSLLGMVTAWLSGDLLRVRQIGNLATASRRLVEGDLSARSGTSSGVGEIDQLAESFDRIADSLLERQHQILEAEGALRASEYKMRRFIEQSADAITITDEAGIITDWNPAAERIFGIPASEAVGLPIWDVHASLLPSNAQAKRDVSKVRQILQEGLQSGEINISDQSPIPDKVIVDGTVYYVSTNIFPIKTRQGFILGGITRDITQQRQADEALRESELKNRALLDAVPDLIFVIDKKGIFLDYRSSRQAGLDVDDSILGKSISDYLAPDYTTALSRLIKKALHTQKTQEYSFTISFPGNNLERTYEARISSVTENQVLALVRDVTERVRSEKLQEALYTISVLANSIQDLGTFYSNVHELLAGLLPAKNLYIALYDEEAGRVDFPYYVDEHDDLMSFHTNLEALGQGVTVYVIRTGQPVMLTPSSIRIHIENGEFSPVGTIAKEYLGVPLKTAAGKIVGVMAVQTYEEGVHYTDRDMELLVFVSTQIAMAIERKQAEEALRMSEESYRTVVETSPDAILVTDKNNVILFANQMAAELHGLEDPAMHIGHRVIELIAPEDMENARKYGRLVQEEGIVRDAWYRLVRRADKSRVQVSISMSMLRDKNGEPSGYIVIGRDMTETVHRTQEREAIISVSSALRTAATRAEIISILLEKVSNLLQAGGALLALDTGGDLTYERSISIEQATGLWANCCGNLVNRRDGILAETIAKGEPFITNDPMPTPILTGLGQQKSLACLPLIAQEEKIGVLALTTDYPLTKEDQRMLVAIADMAANALQRSQLFEDAQRRVNRLGALHIIDLAINASVDLKVTVEVVLQQVITQLGVDAADILVLQRGTNLLHLLASITPRRSGATPNEYRMGEDFAGQAALERRTIALPDLSLVQIPNHQYHMMCEEGYNAYYAVPLISKGELRGVMEIYNRTRLFPDSEWEGFLSTLAGQAAIAIDNADMFQGLQRSNQDLILAYDTTLEGWAKALELRDGETEGHSQRVVEMTIRLAQMLGIHGEQIHHLRRGAILHDIGKMGIPDSILLKPGTLDDTEWEIMHRHPVYAHDMLAPIEFLRHALDIPYCHHEKWDGSGYPRGLAGIQIPQAARIFAIVDVWDALTADRPYRKAWTPDKALDYIREQSGHHFDPQVVSAFFQLIAEEGDRWITGKER